MFDDPRRRAWPPTRAEGLARIEAFRPRMGGVYAGKRNFDHGPARRDNVSQLSPYVRRRLVTERELIRAALDSHGPEAAEKFIQEVFWRSYWKGWLEQRPSVWVAYRAGVAADRAAVQADAPRARRLAAAEAGATGLDCFDAWAQELVETGYLHNHTRMWFASIWTFTLGLPWRLGADFFLRHLLDGDAAANTLGWRWVAGLHTRGKHYVAQGWNIEKFTAGRFAPGPRDLAADPAPLAEDDGPRPSPLGFPDRPDPDAPTALLITEEDCTPETLGLDLAALRATAVWQASGDRSALPVAPAVAEFDRGALADAAERARAAGAPTAERLADATPDDLAGWARRAGARQIVTAYLPAGWVRDRLHAARPALAAAGVKLVEVRRPWDDAVWPHATAGFFKVKEKIPRLLDALA